MLLRKLLPIITLSTMMLSSVSAFGDAQILSADSSNAIPGQYIVVLKEQLGMRLMSNESFVTYESARVASETGLSVVNHFRQVMPGFVVKANKRQIRKLAQDPAIDYIEQDQMMYTNQVPWGLDRIDQRTLPLNGSYNFGVSGFDVHAYIIDTGILSSHVEFRGRMGSGWSGINDGRGTEDCNGHGTHVAGTVGGTTYGVAKNVTLHSIRVFGCDGGTTNSTIINSVDWVAANHIKPAVANMSLGGGASPALDSAVRRAVQQGVVMVVAAGNSNADACTASPARESTAITVAASTINDGRSSFSNWGNCVDIFAPGSNIQSAWFTGSNAVNSISGTSMAAPHAAGVVAQMLQLTPNASPADIANRLTRSATTGRISDVKGSPNLMLFADLTGGGGVSSSPQSSAPASSRSSVAISSRSASSISSPVASSSSSTANLCGGVAAWSATQVYTVTMRATLGGNLYEAKWWTRGESPAQNSTQWGVWRLLGACR